MGPAVPAEGRAAHHLDLQVQRGDHRAHQYRPTSCTVNCLCRPPHDPPDSGPRQDVDQPDRRGGGAGGGDTPPPAYWPACSPRRPWCRWGRNAARSRRGAKEVGLCQVAAEGASRGQLVSEERLDRGQRTRACRAALKGWLLAVGSGDAALAGDRHALPGHRSAPAQECQQRPVRGIGSAVSIAPKALAHTKPPQLMT